MFNKNSIKDYILDNNTIIAFDCFDTIISRKVPPEYVLKLWIKELILLFDLDSTIEEMYTLFLSLDIKKINDNYLLVKNFKKTFNIKEDEDYIKQKLIQIMVDTECRVTYANKDIVELLHYIYNLNKRIILISDYYLSKKHLVTILKHHSVDIYFDNIFVSCDYTANKTSGELYKIVLQKLDIKPDGLLMMGDNIYSDYRVPSKLRIKSFYIDRKVQFDLYDDFNKKYSDWHSVLKNSIIRTDFIKNNNLQNMAFAFYEFIDRLYSLLLKNNIKSVFFLAREGKFLKCLFDLYRQEQGYQNSQYINSDYLYVSRQSVLIASLKKLNIENFKLIFERHKNMSIYKFLHALNFNQDQIEVIKNELPEINIANEINKINKSPEFARLVKLPLFIKFYEEKRKEQRINLSNYFKRKNLKNPINLVDIGWKGSIQDGIYQFYQKKRQIRGFYFGHIYSSKYQYFKDDNNKKYGIMCNLNLDKNEYDKLSRIYIGFAYIMVFYELLTTCEDGSVAYYTQNDVIFNVIKEEKEYFICKIKPIQDEIYFLYCKILNEFKMKAISFNDYKSEFINIQLKLLEKIKNIKIESDFMAGLQ